MAYCVQADITNMLPEAVLIRLTDDGNAGEIDADRLNESIDTAADEIDAYIGSRYALPISGTVPKILIKLNADIALYNLYSRVKEQVPELRAERYKAAVRILEKLAAGKISIGLQPPPDPPASGNYERPMQVSARTQIFSSAGLDKY